jgi:rRNA maturation endonuclease Nob1
MRIAMNVKNDQITEPKNKMISKTLNADKYKVLNHSTFVKYYIKAISKSKPLLVREAIVYKDNNAYWVCPNCRSTFDREYQSYCDRCGQKLKWQPLKNIIYLKKTHK